MGPWTQHEFFEGLSADKCDLTGCFGWGKQCGTTAHCCYPRLGTRWGGGPETGGAIINPLFALTWVGVWPRMVPQVSLT